MCVFEEIYFFNRAQKTSFKFNQLQFTKNFKFGQKCKILKYFSAEIKDNILKIAFCKFQIFCIRFSGHATS